ncbi:hypothetical protein L198_01578 [Cryptococcus wingfieldii CBS 7118]|uniref:DNA polymerase delta subunit 4 n=1 Tax=Cryptococcus wingfieldii CBS 7118 TaxID=1295528 RepID=A0A1E3JZW9_9TREE|nr:hypothetical protein L198_01578 [Cryptococcus wingfieldii CBS 7118]ODO06346.1 hypothetical protein L198_01578 [Cryptococcus wingfieldii CBS 7118]
MPPRKSTAASARTSGRTKKAAGVAQPLLSFQSQGKPSRGATSKTKPSLQKESSAVSIPGTKADEGDDDDIQVVDEPQGTKDGSAKGGKKPQLKVKSKEWSKVLKEAEAAMGDLEPIHAGPNTHNDIHHILRVFDLSTKYGPCVGIARLQRWERAKQWGLDPPDEGEDDASYRENVLSAWL